MYDYEAGHKQLKVMLSYFLLFFFFFQERPIHLICKKFCRNLYNRSP